MIHAFQIVTRSHSSNIKLFFFLFKHQNRTLFCKISSSSLSVRFGLVLRRIIVGREKMDGKGLSENELNLKETELRLGLPGRDENEKENESSCSFRNNKRVLSESSKICGSGQDSDQNGRFSTGSAPPSKAQIVGWPPIRSYRKNCLFPKKFEAENEKAGIYVKVSMDGAPYLRKIDLSIYEGYSELLKALEDMFKITVGEYSEREGYTGSKHSPTYEDKDGDWMLVGDVPWEMFMSSCNRLRIMKGSEARGLK